MSLKYGLLLVLALAAAQAALAAGRQKPLPLPKRISPEIIADNTRYNGAPLQIVQFMAKDADDVIDFYRKYFKDKAGDGQYTERNTTQRKLIGGLLDGCLVNVEIVPKEKDAAYVLVTSLDVEELQDPEKLSADILRMSGSKVVQHQESRDGNKSNSIVIVRNGYSVESNAMYLREKYISRNWERMRDITIKAGKHRLLAFNREFRHLMIDIQKTDADTTTVIYNEIRE